MVWSLPHQDQVHHATMQVDEDYQVLISTNMFRLYTVPADSQQQTHL